MGKTFLQHLCSFQHISDQPSMKPEPQYILSLRNSVQERAAC